MSLAVWRFTPVASAADPAWQDRQIWTGLEIVAETAGEAMVAAARYESLRTGLTDIDSQDHQQRRSGFSDPSLYRVDRLEREAPAGARSGQVVNSG